MKKDEISTALKINKMESGSNLYKEDIQKRASTKQQLEVRNIKNILDCWSSNQFLALYRVQKLLEFNRRKTELDTAAQWIPKGQ